MGATQTRATELFDCGKTALVLQLPAQQEKWNMWHAHQTR
jgi:hypothetical protein